jgi:SAM-dependent methyltransferase
MSSKTSAPPPTTQQNGPLNLLRPLLLMSYSLAYLVPTVAQLVSNFQFKTFFDIDEFKDVWFARFWAFFGPKAREVAAPFVMPLLQNNARGVCLDIGPGSGQWLYLFQRANNPEITKIYGIEPNPGMHKALRENAVKAGLGKQR